MRDRFGWSARLDYYRFGGDSLQGRQVAQYQVGERLGSGGMGDVYAATDRMGRAVALKVLAPRLVQDRQYVSRFLQEARAVLALNHPNIVTVYDIGEADGTYYIASELIEGETLRAALSRGRLALGPGLEVAIQVCTALSAAHERGVVHRDIKPENVMLRGDGYVKVLDFGVAKLTGQFRGPDRAGAAADACARPATGCPAPTRRCAGPGSAARAHRHRPHRRPRAARRRGSARPRWTPRRPRPGTPRRGASPPPAGCPPPTLPPPPPSPPIPRAWSGAWRGGAARGRCPPPARRRRRTTPGRRGCPRSRAHPRACG
ncbi:MAG TPA: hypothetical protein DEB06_01420 [Phycisphaerales bacterium]|nr:hypothetical protein [Phycisphaerales bacterium]